jgi:CRISPR-associated protein Cas2
MQHYLICYDIKNPKRLRRVYKYAQNYALHLQKSVFGMEMTLRQRNELAIALAQLIQREDDIRIYATEPVNHFQWYGVRTQFSDEDIKLL